MQEGAILLADKAFDNDAIRKTGTDGTNPIAENLLCSVNGFTAIGTLLSVFSINLSNSEALRPVMTNGKQDQNRIRNLDQNLTRPNVKIVDCKGF